jgi:outer membrane protein TolC
MARRFSIESRPAWQEAAAREQVARLALKESRQGALPKLNLNGRYAYNMQSKLEAGSNNVEFDVSNISLRAELPLFQGNYYRSLRKKNELLLQSASIERERTAALLDEQQRNWMTQYRTAYSRQEALRQKLSASADNLRIARLSLEEAVMEFDEFNNIFMEYSRARMEYIQNQADGVLYYLLSTQNF